MEQMITRGIVSTKCHLEILEKSESGYVVVAEKNLEFNGKKLDERKCRRILDKNFGFSDKLYNLEVRYVTKKYGMPISVFMEYSEELDGEE